MKIKLEQVNKQKDKIVGMISKELLKINFSEMEMKLSEMALETTERIAEKNSIEKKKTIDLEEIIAEEIAQLRLMILALSYGQLKLERDNEVGEA